MNYDRKKGRSCQIPNLTPDHKPLESRGEMSSNWGVLYTIGKIFLKIIIYHPCITWPKKFGKGILAWDKACVDFGLRLRK
jgi:hypothetical protein